MMQHPKRWPKLAIAICVVVLAVMPSFDIAQMQDDPPADEDCVVPPEDGSADEDDRDRSSDETRSERLADCGGVLKPPATGDQELVEPAPDEGRTPVIPPRALPDTPEDEDQEGD